MSRSTSRRSLACAWKEKLLHCTVRHQIDQPWLTQSPSLLKGRRLLLCLLLCLLLRLLLCLLLRLLLCLLLCLPLPHKERLRCGGALVLASLWCCTTSELSTLRLRYGSERLQRHGKQIIVANRVSLKRSLRQPDVARRAHAMAAAEKEVMQLITTTAVLPVKRSTLSRQEIDSIIPAHAFITEKEHADSMWDKTKCRLVAGGNFIDGTSVGENYAPVLLPIVAMIMLDLASKDGDEVGTCDIEGAYLVPDLLPVCRLSGA